MKFCKLCPICNSEELKLMQNLQFVAEGQVKPPTISSSISNVDERLWIYFHKIRKDLSPSILQATLCNSCGFIFYNPRLTERDITTKYETINILGFDKKRHLNVKKPHFIERSKRISDLMAEIIGREFQDNNLQILDYGGAEGYLLKPLLEHGHETFLLDYISYPLPDERIVYLGKDLSDLKEGQKFDVIFLLHTLEHVYNPVKLLSELKEKLKPGGWLYIEVPLGAWLEWENIKEPLTHVNFFSEQSLTRTVIEAGLHPHYLNTQWQWVTSSINLCINLVCKHQAGHNRVTPLSTIKQMQPFRYVFKALQINARYFGKTIIKSLLKASK